MKKNLKQNEVAQMVHVEKSTISNYETGKTMPSYPVLIKLANLYQVNLDYLFGRTKIRSSLEQIEKGLVTRSGLLSIDEIFALNLDDRELLRQFVHLLKNQKHYK